MMDWCCFYVLFHSIEMDLTCWWDPPSPWRFTDVISCDAEQEDGLNHIQLEDEFVITAPVDFSADGNKDCQKQFLGEIGPTLVFMILFIFLLASSVENKHILDICWCTSSSPAEAHGGSHTGELIKQVNLKMLMLLFC